MNTNFFLFSFTLFFFFFSSPVLSLGSIVVEPVELPNCDNIPPGTQNCYYRIIYKTDLCTHRNPCDKLLVYWSGGEQSVKDGNYDATMKTWARRGYVAVAAQPFDDAKEAGKYPYFYDQERLSYITKVIRENVTSIWSGEYFVFGGVSRGATSPPISVANGNLFNNYPEIWTGTQGTAVVLFDGISNTATWEEWLSSQDEGVTGDCYELHSRTVGRYGEGSPLAHSCNNHKCYCSNPKSKDVWSNDSLVIGSDYPPSPYNCSVFSLSKGSDQQQKSNSSFTVWYRFTACEGKELPPCNPYGDIVPTPQQQLPYEALTNCDPSYQIITSFEVIEECGHSLCGGASVCGSVSTIDWLKEQWGE